MHTLNTASIRRRFDRAAKTFDTADFVHSLTRDALFSRLQPVSVDASLVLDLGCATGAAVRGLEKRFRGARVVGVDIAGNMLQRAGERRGWFSKSALVQADARALPFDDNSVDVVYSNLLLPWIDDPATVASEVARVLRKDGLFAFATLGPDSLLELRSAWAGVDDDEHVNRFIDMHDVGDSLVRSGLRDPVLDVDRLSVSYDDPEALFRDLTATGSRNSLVARRTTLTGRHRFERLRNSLKRDESTRKIHLELELVYGHCWGGAEGTSAGGVRIDPASIAVRRR